MSIRSLFAILLVLLVCIVTLVVANAAHPHRDHDQHHKHDDQHHHHHHHHHHHKHHDHDHKQQHDITTPITLIAAAEPDPLPLPNVIVPNGTVDHMGRIAVHGWLILPLDGVDEHMNNAYFVHHTPEFWTDSPHDFQMILKGVLWNSSLVPHADIMDNEYTWTPPAFSLDDLILDLHARSPFGMHGNVYNGSFDTIPQPRVQVGIAYVKFSGIATPPVLHYLNNATTVVPYPTLTYISMPRLATNPTANPTSTATYYWSSLIHAIPGFDSVLQVRFSLANDCEFISPVPVTNPESLYQLITYEGATFTIPDSINDVTKRLRPSSFDHTIVHRAQLMTQQTNTTVFCNVQIVKEIHCVVGPAFADRCPQ